MKDSARGATDVQSSLSSPAGQGESGEVGLADGLPAGWAASTLGEITEKITDGSHAPPKGQSEGLPMISAKNISNGSMTLDAPRLIEPDAFEKEDRRTSIRPNDVLLTIVGAIGRSVVVPEGLPRFTVQRSVSVIKPTEVDPQFLSYQFRAPTYQSFLDANAKGTAQKGVYLRTLGESPLCIAPKAEQVRIVSAIESLQERSARAKQALCEVGPLLSQLRQSVLRGAFSGRLTERWRTENRGVEPASELLARIRTERRERWEAAQLAKYEAKGKQPPKNWQGKYKEPEPVDESELEELPDGWCWVRIGTVLDVVSGNAFKSKDFQDEGVPVVKIANVSYGKFVWKQQEYLPESFLDANPNFHVNSGDTLLALTRPITENRLKACVYPDNTPPALLNQRVAMLRTILPETKGYLTSLLHTDYFKELVSSLLSETLQPNLSPVDLQAAPIPLAPLAEQPEIVKAAKMATETVRNLNACVASSEAELTQLDQSILAKAFRGELVPQDSGDEPASQLLHRIRTTRAQLEAEKKAAKKKPKRTKRKQKGKETT